MRVQFAGIERFEKGTRPRDPKSMDNVDRMGIEAEKMRAISFARSNRQPQEPRQVIEEPDAFVVRWGADYLPDAPPESVVFAQ